MSAFDPTTTPSENRVFELPSAWATLNELLATNRVSPATLLEFSYYAAEEDLCAIMRAASVLDPHERSRALEHLRTLHQPDQRPARKSAT